VAIRRKKAARGTGVVCLPRVAHADPGIHAALRASVGEDTEVVEKQMYTFADRDGQSVSMRPEGTVSAVRAYVARSQWNREPVTRWYYLARCSATTAPSAAACASSTSWGRVFGLASPSVDAEMKSLCGGAAGRRRGSNPPTSSGGEHFGRPEERRSYREALPRYFLHHLDKLDERLAASVCRPIAAHPVFQGSRYPSPGRHAPVLLDGLATHPNATLRLCAPSFSA